jgi:ribosomal protein L19E
MIKTTARNETKRAWMKTMKSVRATLRVRCTQKKAFMALKIRCKWFLMTRS